MLKDLSGLQEHVNCKNCGWCCCIVPIAASEDVTIRQYIQEMDSAALQRLVEQPRGQNECQFRDREQKRCAIYAVRPAICRMFGSVLGMNCPQGNSANLNIRHELTKQPLRLMPEYIDRKISATYSGPLARLSTAETYFKQVSCFYATTEIEYKYRNYHNLFQIYIEIDSNTSE